MPFILFFTHSHMARFYLTLIRKYNISNEITPCYGMESPRYFFLLKPLTFYTSFTQNNIHTPFLSILCLKKNRIHKFKVKV